MPGRVLKQVVCYGIQFQSNKQQFTCQKPIKITTYRTHGPKTSTRLLMMIVKNRPARLIGTTKDQANC